MLRCLLPRAARALAPPARRAAASFGCTAPRIALAGAARMSSTAAPPQPAPPQPTSWEVVVDPSNFAAEVMESPVPVILDCHASWCQPCQQLKPILQRAVSAAGGRLKLATLDTEAHPQLTQQLQVRSLPTVFGLSGGKLVDSFVGLMPQPQLEEFLRKLLAFAPDVAPEDQPATEPPADSAAAVLARAAKLLEEGSPKEAADDVQALYATLLDAEAPAAAGTEDKARCLAMLARCAFAAGAEAECRALIEMLKQKVSRDGRRGGQGRGGGGGRGGSP